MYVPVSEHSSKVQSGQVGPYLHTSSLVHPPRNELSSSLSGRVHKSVQEVPYARDVPLDHSVLYCCESASILSYIRV